MKRYILSICVTILILTSFSVFWFSYNQVNTVRQHLKTTINAIKISEIAMDYSEFVKKITNIRVTILDENGNVLADNRVDVANLKNHSNRKEFIQARQEEYGEDIRVSESTGEKDIYVMTKLKEGIYIRLAQPISLTYSFLIWLLTPILFLSLMLAILIFIFTRNKQMENLRSEFVANVSHELKTPLTSIKGFAELISSGLVSDLQIIKEYQGKIVTQSDQLLNMINDILHLSKIESTKPKKLSKIDTYSIAAQVRENLRFFADGKDIIIQVTGQGSIKAEIEAIYEMLYNLVDNSIKYGKNGGYVKIILDKQKITVADNGIGIPQKDLERVFERFYRVDKGRSKESGGTGLGLAIVKRTALKYGAKIKAISDLGSGTEITIEFK